VGFGRRGTRNVIRGILTLCVGGLIIAPGAFGQPGAVDQYTESPPSGPGGSNTEIGTESGPNDGTSKNAGAKAPGPAPAPVQSSPASPAESAAPPPADTSGGEQTVAKSSEPGNGAAPKPKQQDQRPEQSPPAEPPPPHNRAAVPASSADDGDSLPLIGYPSSPFVAVALAIGLGALVVGGGIAAYGRIRRPAGDTG
jgi:hypothetical protein